MELLFILFFAVGVLDSSNDVNTNMVKTKKTSHFLGINVTISPTYERFVSNLSIAEISARGSPDISMNFTLASTVPASEAFIKTTFYIRQLVGQSFTPWFVSKRYNVCELLNKSKPDRLLHTFLQNVKPYTTLMQHCPFVPGDYVISRFAIDMSLVPSFIPSSTYVFKLEYIHFTRKRYINAVTLYASVELRSV